MRAERLYLALCALLMAAGVWLAFAHLTALGLTWDEYLDWRIAESIAHTHDVLGNLSDPSQGRLAHMVAALSFMSGGFSYAAYKLPFVVIGLLGAALLFAACQRHFSLPSAAAITAFYLTNPYVLGSMRTAATAGDVLVLVLVLAFVLTLDRWLTERDFWRAGWQCALVCGVAVGAKWTNGLGVPLALVAVVAAQRQWLAPWPGTPRPWGDLAKDLLCFLLLAGLAAVAANPTFLLGIKFVLGALAHAHGYDHGLRLYLGRLVDGPEWYFLPAILLAKLGIPFLLALLAALGGATARRRSVPAIVWLSLATSAFALLFALKPFQSAYYYIFLVGPLAMVVAWWLRDSGAIVRWLFLASVVLQAAQAFAIAPDFLHSGAGYGAAFEGEFWGPAVNHCQGGPRLLEAVAARIGPQARIYTLTDCYEILAFDAAHVATDARVFDYPASGRVSGPHVVAVHRVYFVGGDSVQRRAQRQARFEDVTRGCDEIANDGQPYRIFSCP